MAEANNSELFSKEHSQDYCSDCSKLFNISEWESSFLAKFDLPLPKRCPSCRAMRRLLHLNQVNLTKRTCNATNKQVLSNYSEDVIHPVYVDHYWFSDAFDGREYGQEFDFSRPFFPQLKELRDRVPHPALLVDYANNENSAYVNYAGNLKSCYLVFNSNYDQDCLYSYGLDDSRSSLDCLRVGHSELCYEAVNCERCYRCGFISQSDNCTESYFLRNCVSCDNCFMCVNLRHKKFYVRNKPVTPEVFHELVAALKSQQRIVTFLAEFEAFRREFPERYMHGVRVENSSGNFLVGCRNAFGCFDAKELWDGMYASQSFAPLRDFYDCNECGGGELMCSSANTGFGYNLRCCFTTFSQVHDADYCSFCVYGCAHVFGCVGLKRNEYCILNKQYTADEFFALKNKIIAHMKTTKEWGEFFPAEFSDFPYNLTQAQVHYPLTRERALELGFRWQDDTAQQINAEATFAPATLDEASDDLVKTSLSCEDCGRIYRIQKPELKLHRDMGIALARRCFHCRHRARNESRTKREIYQRSCDQCQASIETSYPPTHPQRVYCEACFSKAMD